MNALVAITFNHVFYIPLIVTGGFIIGFFVGQRVLRARIAEREREERERARRRREREERRAGAAAAPVPAQSSSVSESESSPT